MRKRYTVRMRSVYSGRLNTMSIKLTPEEWKEVQPFIRGDWREVGSRHIQEILPNYTPQEREFFISGMTENEWNEMHEGSDE